MNEDNELTPGLLAFDSRAGAVFSPDRKYRYLLWRQWDLTKPSIAFVMLNPSTADERILDNTVRRCIQYAKKWGYGRIEVGNIFALRSTDPAALYTSSDPVGPENDRYLREIARTNDRIIVAWGNHGQLHNRDLAVLKLFSSPYCLSVNGTRLPKHPLYCSLETKPVAYDRNYRSGSLNAT